MNTQIKDVSDKLRNCTCLGENHIYSTDEKISGINGNELIVGPTRVGKTMSVVEPRLLHTYDSSIIVSLTKRQLVDQYAQIFKERGYKVLDLNLINLKEGNVSYDPMDYVKNEKDINNLARNIIGGNISKDHQGNVDPYWNESATSMISAILGLAYFEAKDNKRKASFVDFLKLYAMAKPELGHEVTKSELDHRFKMLSCKHPGNQFSLQWKTFSGIAPKTASCIFSIANACIDKISGKEVIDSMKAKPGISFKSIGQKKTILFVTTSPVNKSLQKMANMFFTDAFRELFEFAESRKDRVLPVPVHLICDDFATGSTIPDFAEYLSVFCAKRMSVTLLLQSESQLESMYGHYDAITIINNCDTYLYMGGMDNETCKDVSLKANVPLEDVYSMPVGKVYVIRRGAKAELTERYQIFNDDLYKQYVLADDFEK